MGPQLAGNREVFGKQGLGQWIEDDELSPEQRALIADPAEAVPFPLLRRAVVRVWTDLGRRVADPADPGGGAR